MKNEPNNYSKPLDPDLINAKRGIIFNAEDETTTFNSYILWTGSINLDKPVVASKGFWGSVFLFSADAWYQFEELLRIKFEPFDKPVKRMIGRFFIAGAVDIILSDITKIPLPEHLLNHAKIEKEAVITGNGNGYPIIVWSKETWESEKEFIYSKDGMDSLERLLRK